MNLYEQVVKSEFELIKYYNEKYKNVDLSDDEISKITDTLLTRGTIIEIIQDEIFRYIENNFELYFMRKED